jgi:hypothetical protein
MNTGTCIWYMKHSIHLPTNEPVQPVAYPGIFFRGGGFQQIQLRTKDRERGSAPSQGFWRQL